MAVYTHEADLLYGVEAAFTDLMLWYLVGLCVVVFVVVMLGGRG